MGREYLNVMVDDNKSRPRWFRTANPDRYELLKRFAKENRNHPTEAEKVLWSLIKGKALGAKFIRQHIIHDYIADFVALEEYLIIEVDGGYHYQEEQMTWDAYRTEELETIGFKVIRLNNNEVLCDINTVIDKITDELNNIQRTKIIK